MKNVTHAKKDYLETSMKPKNLLADMMLYYRGDLILVALGQIFLHGQGITFLTQITQHVHACSVFIQAVQQYYPIEICLDHHLEVLIKSNSLLVVTIE